MSKELEAVKHRISATVLRVARSNGKTHFSNDIRWLIKQAERVEELEEGLMTAHAPIGHLEQENERLREALEKIAKAGENQLTGIEMMSIAINALLEEGNNARD